MNDLTQQLLSALSKRAPQIAYGDSPEQFVDSVIATVIQPYAERADRESKLACKLAQRLFDKGDQYHSTLQWDGNEWLAKEIRKTAREFYEANATNVCNVPRVEHPEDPSGWDGVRRASEARFIAKDALVMTLQDACEFAEKFAANRGAK